MENHVNHVIVGAGSNIDPAENVFKVTQVLRKYFHILKTSRFVKTLPVGHASQPHFLNGAFLIQTQLDEKTLKQRLKEIERRLGRLKSHNKNQPRPIDLDILIWNGKVVDRDVYERDFLKSEIRELIPTISFSS
jgi:2-amino-4-hydroxy-6-hydroxymethyldihydropteridine diphosphokinase